MSNSPLYDELLGLGYASATNPIVPGDIVYIKNQTDAVRKIKVSVGTGNPNALVDLTWQNPTLKPSLTDPALLTSCLGKGLIPITLHPVVLDEVAFESSTANILNLGSTLSYTDYQTSVVADQVDFIMGYNVSGERFTIHGLATDTYDLSLIGQDAGNDVAILEYKGLFWSARQIKNALVYTATGKPVLPVYVKWDIVPDGDITQTAFTASEINATFGISGGTSPAEIQINYAGFSVGTRYETQELSIPYTCVHKTLLDSILILTIPDDDLLALFETVTSANIRYNSSAVISSLTNNTLTGTAGIIEGQDLAFVTGRIPKAAYAQLELLQWTNPDLTVVRLGKTNYTVQQVMDMVQSRVLNDGSGPITEYFIPLWFYILSDTALNQIVSLDVGYNGLVINNEWSVTHTELTNDIRFADQFANPGPATAITTTTLTDGPVEIVIDGVSTTYPTIQAMLDDNDAIRLVNGDYWKALRKMVVGDNT